MNRITISIELPDGIVPDVTYSSAGSPSPAPRPAAATPPPVAAGHSSWQCPEHGTQKIRTWPDGGVSCGVQGGSNVNTKGYCKFRAPKAASVAPAPAGAPLPPPPEENFDDLPF